MEVFREYISKEKRKIQKKKKREEDNEQNSREVKKCKYFTDDNDDCVNVADAKMLIKEIEELTTEKRDYVRALLESVLEKHNINCDNQNKEKLATKEINFLACEIECKIFDSNDEVSKYKSLLLQKITDIENGELGEKVVDKNNDTMDIKIGEEYMSPSLITEEYYDLDNHNMPKINNFSTRLEVGIPVVVEVQSSCGISKNMEEVELGTISEEYMTPLLTSEECYNLNDHKIPEMNNPSTQLEFGISATRENLVNESNCVINKNIDADELIVQEKVTKESFDENVLKKSFLTEVESTITVAQSIAGSKTNVNYKKDKNLIDNNSDIVKINITKKKYVWPEIVAQSSIEVSSQISEDDSQETVFDALEKNSNLDMTAKIISIMPVEGVDLSTKLNNEDVIVTAPDVEKNIVKEMYINLVEKCTNTMEIVAADEFEKQLDITEESFIEYIPREENSIPDVEFRDKCIVRIGPFIFSIVFKE